MSTERKVTFSIFVRSTPERVYDALATAEGLDGWFTTGTFLDARPGGRLVFRWKNWGPYSYTGELGGPVLEARRPERFVFQWPVDSGLYSTTVEIGLEPRPEGAMVSLVEHGYREGPEMLQDMLNRAAGWGNALTLMKFYVEHGLRY